MTKTLVRFGAEDEDHARKDESHTGCGRATDLVT